jgi:hypothetical protein
MPDKSTTPSFVLRACEFCGKDILIPAWCIRRGQGRFCSQPCWGAQRTALARGHRANLQNSRARNRAFVAAIRSRTVCANCGGQPVEWHNPDHVLLNRQAFRISRMVNDARPLAAIEQEIACCTPLCRRCHLTEDGRLAALQSKSRAQPKRAPKPCVACDCLAKPLRRGMCDACYRKAMRRLGQ